MSVEHHTEGNAFIENTAVNLSPAFDATVQTGRAVALGVTNDLPIPTHVDGYITYHNLDTNTITQEATDGTDKVFNEVTLNNILTHKTALDATSLANIQAEPNLLAELGINGSAVGVNITLDADDSYYAVSEASGADVFDARYTNDTAITGVLTNVRISGQSKGLQTTALVLNASGVPTAYNDTAGTAKVYSDTIINTGFKPNIGRFSIDETVSGELQDFGSELVTNGTFDTDTDWENKGTVWTIEGGIATSNDNQIQQLYQENLGFVENHTYIAEIEIISIESGSYQLQYHNGTFVDIASFNSVGTFTIEFTISGIPNGRLYIKSSFAVGSLDNVSVKEITTKTQRTERRVLTHDVTATPQDHYYIGTDGGAMVEQSVVPALPSPTTVIDLNDTPVIGYADTIDTRHDQFVITSTVITP